MKLDQLKKGFFGYKKASVYEYIAMMEEEFSAKLSAKESEYKENEEKYSERIKLLEEELKNTKEELEENKKAQMTIASTLMEATRYRDTLCKDADKRAEEERKKWEKELAQRRKELDKYQAQVSSLKEMLLGLLQKMEDEAEEFDSRIEYVKSACPSHNMTLFERKKESEE